MTTAVDQLPDGRLFVPSFDALSTAEGMDLLRAYKIEHVVWVGPLDTGLATFAGNFGVTFQVGDGVMKREVEAKRILVVGKN